LKQSKAQNFIPYGVAQGWDVKSYVNSVVCLQKMGYEFITIGGVVTLDSNQICKLIEEINNYLARGTKLHLLGIGRPELSKRLKS
ncbi:tRNA-guanine transglycosylase, partial [Vibrio parahaemolyticus]